MKNPMHSTTVVWLLCIAIINTDAYAQKPKSNHQESSATLVESLNFINQKLTTNFGPRPIYSPETKIIDAELAHTGNCSDLRQ